MPSNNTEQRKLAAIMFTDMVGYSALAQRAEALALELLEEHRSLLRSLFPRFNGREVKTIGDAFLVEFHSALEAAQCAIEIQRTLSKRNHDVPAARRVEVRIGIHIGDVVQRADGDVLGDGVNIASRIEPLAGANGICISVDVERQIRNTIEASLVKLGATELKNIQVPMELFRIVLPWEKAPDGGSRREEARSSAQRSESLLRSGATRSFRTVALWVFGVALIVGSSGWLLYQVGKGQKQVANPHTNAPTPTAQSPEEKSVAVLPFANMGADKADEYLCDGISEEIITALSKIKGLKVPARTSCFVFKGKNEDIQKIGQRLHVKTVLEGSISKVGNRLRVTAQLISIADGFHLWTETYDRSLDDLLAIRTEVASRVAEALKGQLMGEEKQQLAKGSTEDAEAHRLYLQARYLWNRRTGENLNRAIQYFNRAIGKDPSYALAWAGLADCYVLLPDYANLLRLETTPKARAAASKALELDSSLAEPQATLAQIKGHADWDWASAEAGFRRSIELDPNYATAHHWFSNTLLPLGRLEEALAELKRAQEIDPLSPVINACLAEALFQAGKEDQAIGDLQKQVALDPSFVVAHDSLGQAYLSKGRFSEAVAEFETVQRLDPKGAFDLCGLGRAYTGAGRTNDAQKILGQLQELQQQGFDYRVAIAVVQHAMGDDGPALESLELAFKERAGDLESLNYERAWKDLRPHPRVQAILKRMNLVK